MNATATYFRTAKGDHRHTDFHCANYRRSIHLGDVITMTPAEAADYAPCDVCCPGDEVKAAAAAAQAKSDAMCTNSGVTHPGRIESTCRDCGKRGKVNRSTGKLRGHKPAN
jgi:hypothetical protein